MASLRPRVARTRLGLATYPSGGYRPVDRVGGCHLPMPRLVVRPRGPLPPDPTAGRARMASRQSRKRPNLASDPDYQSSHGYLSGTTPGRRRCPTRPFVAGSTLAGRAAASHSSSPLCQNPSNLLLGHRRPLSRDGPRQPDRVAPGIGQDPSIQARPHRQRPKFGQRSFASTDPRLGHDVDLGGPALGLRPHVVIVLDVMTFRCRDHPGGPRSDVPFRRVGNPRFVWSLPTRRRTTLLRAVEDRFHLQPGCTTPR